MGMACRNELTLDISQPLPEWRDVLVPVDNFKSSVKDAWAVDDFQFHQTCAEGKEFHEAAQAAGNVSKGKRFQRNAARSADELVKEFRTS